MQRQQHGAANGCGCLFIGGLLLVMSIIPTAFLINGIVLFGSALSQPETPPLFMLFPLMFMCVPTIGLLIIGLIVVSMIKAWRSGPKPGIQIIGSKTPCRSCGADIDCSAPICPYCTNTP